MCFSQVKDGDTNAAEIIPSKIQTLSSAKKKRNRLAQRKSLKRKLLASDLNSKSNVDKTSSLKQVDKKASKKSKVDKDIEKVSTKDDETAVQIVDTSLWDHLFVPEPILKAISELGFSKPMPIQEQVCLLVLNHVLLC